MLKRRWPKATRVDEFWWDLNFNSRWKRFHLLFLLGCDKTQISDDVKKCAAVIIDSTSMSPSENPSSSDKSSRNASPVTQLEPQKSSAGFVTSVCAVFALIFVAVCWVFYAYTHPHSNSGQFLIQYGRPSSWSWRRGTARYTAATIHMWSIALLKIFSTFTSSYNIILYLVSTPINWFNVMTQRDCKSTDYTHPHLYMTQFLSSFR